MYIHTCTLHITPFHKTVHARRSVISIQLIVYPIDIEYHHQNITMKMKWALIGTGTRPEGSRKEPVLLSSSLSLRLPDSAPLLSAVRAVDMVV